MIQYLHVRLFWRPRPGKTTTDKSAIDAVVRYILATPDGVALYSGAGFAYPRISRDGKLRLSLETARLDVDTVAGKAPEVLGASRLRGEFHAREDANRVVAMVRDAERLAGERAVTRR